MQQQQQGSSRSLGVAAGSVSLLHAIPNLCGARDASRTPAAAAKGIHPKQVSTAAAAAAAARQQQQRSAGGREAVLLQSCAPQGLAAAAG